MKFLQEFARAFVLLMILASIMFVAGQTSYSPPNLKVILDFAFESAVKTADPYKKYFPKPTLIERE